MLAIQISFAFIILKFPTYIFCWLIKSFKPHITMVARMVSKKPGGLFRFVEFFLNQFSVISTVEGSYETLYGVFH